MNLQELAYFVAVAEHRHFGQAARACHISQPTLSGQLRKLEEELGVALFERNNRRVSITPIGEKVLKHARRALEEAGLMAANRELDKGSIGRSVKAWRYSNGGPVPDAVGLGPAAGSSSQPDD